VNLIPLNEAPGIPFKRPSEEKTKQFQEILMEGGLTAIIRASKGAEISAACGQLQARWAPEMTKPIENEASHPEDQVC
jgi:23S rRNA (adenine2503-C2)-methyltransferase